MVVGLKLLCEKLVPCELYSCPFCFNYTLESVKLEHRALRSGGREEAGTAFLSCRAHAGAVLVLQIP